tara:strand:+ start:236 stop:367 length:132 start_codon:yes stop_codon:yes gene_type:complete
MEGGHYFFTIFIFVFVLINFGHINGLKKQLDKIEKLLEEKNDK